MIDDPVKQMRRVFCDNREILSWIDTSTYKGAEVYAHIKGLYTHLIKMAGRVKKLEEANMKASLIKVDDMTRIKTLEEALHYLSEGWPCCDVSKTMREIATEALNGSSANAEPEIQQSSQV